MEKYIITGGPCVGKTGILKKLQEVGENTLDEVAREIIAEEKKKENGILPSTNLAAFQALTMQRQLKREKEISFTKPARIFQDRGLADSIAYREEAGLAVPDELYRLIEQANYTRIFFLEKLPFYIQDAERKESPELALRIHQRLYQVYDRLGFDIVTVPLGKSAEEKASIEERVQFILKEAQCKKNREIERKYRVDHAHVKAALQQYVVKHVGTDNEENTLYDFGDVLKDRGCVFRIRENNGEHLLTVKGPNGSPDMTNKLEYNLSISQLVSKAIQIILPESISYSKRRENYRPLGDARCTISLDQLPELGEFVEIEAATENQVLLWEKRLGIAGYAIKESYPQLVRNAKIANSY